MNTTAQTVPPLAEASLAWLRQHYNSDGMKNHLKHLLTQAVEARARITETKGIYQSALGEVQRVEAELQFAAQQNPDLKNAEARRAAAELARPNSPEWIAAAGALEIARVARDQANDALDNLEATIKTVHLALTAHAAELGALAALVQLPPF